MRWKCCILLIGTARKQVLFGVNGGIWPIHCVAGEKGSALDRLFLADIIDVKNRPNEENIFHKGN